MNKNFKISNYQLFTLLSGFMIGSTLIVTPATGAAQDAWLAFLIGLFYGAILLSIYVYIAKLNPSCTLTSILERNFGKVLGKIFSLMYIWYFVHLSALVLRNFGAYFLTTSYPETPIIFIISCIALVVALCVRAGIEVIGRMSEVFTIIMTAVLCFVFFALIKEFDIENLKPFLSQGMRPVLNTAFIISAFPFGETVVFLMIFPYANKQKNIIKSSSFALLVVGILILSTILRNIMVLGANMASRDVFPSHVVYRLIPGLDLDQLLDINLTVTGVIKASLCIYAAATGLTELLNLEDYKPFVFSMTAFIVALSMWLYDSLLEMLRWAVEIWPYYSIPFQIVIPLILLIISLIKNRKQQAYNKLNSSKDIY